MKSSIITAIRERLEDNMKEYCALPCPSKDRKQIEARRTLADKLMTLQIEHYRIAGNFYEYRYHPHWIADADNHTAERRIK